MGDIGGDGGNGADSGGGSGKRRMTEVMATAKTPEITEGAGDIWCDEDNGGKGSGGGQRRSRWQ